MIHLAAESHVDRSIRDPFTFARTNVMGTLSLLEAAREHWNGNWAGKLFYHISTDEVYGALELTRPAGDPAGCESGGGPFGEEFFTEETKYDPHSPYSASKASSDHFVRAYHDTYGMPTLVTNCSNNYGPYQFPEKLIPLFINNIRHRRPLPVYGRWENVRDWLYVEDHARAIDVIFHKGKVADTYNIGGFNEWKNIDLIRVIVKTVDRLLGNPEGASEKLITYVADRAGHDLRYAIDSRKLKDELGWQPSLQFEEGIEKTVRWYLQNQSWMDDITSGEYQRTVFSIPSSNCRLGSQPSSRLSLRESMAYLRSCPARSVTYVISFSDVPSGLPSSLSTVRTITRIRSMFFHSLKPPMLYVSATLPLWKITSMARA